jgi:hypothetical protein
MTADHDALVGVIPLVPGLHPVRLPHLPGCADEERLTARVDAVPD